VVTIYEALSAADKASVPAAVYMRIKAALAASIDNGTLPSYSGSNTPTGPEIRPIADSAHPSTDTVRANDPGSKN